MKEALKDLVADTNDFIIDLVIALIIIIVGFKIVDIIINSMKKPHKYGKLDPTVKSFLISFLNIALKILVLVIALQILGVSSASIVTVLGSCALAIGLGLQGGLSNIAGSIMILMFKPFKVGDFISTNGYEGTVKSISIFYTKILTPDNKSVQLPNGILSNNNIINYNVNGKRRIDLNITVDYKSNINQVKKVINGVIKKHPKILQDEKNLVRLLSHAESALVFAVKAWVVPEDYWDVYYDLMEQIKEELDKNHISIPFNQLDVHIKK